MQIENIYVIQKNRLFSRYRFNTATPKSNQTTAEFENELRGLAKDGCSFTNVSEHILDRLIITCTDKNLQSEALEEEWDLDKFLKKSTTRTNVAAQKSELFPDIKMEADEEVRMVKRRDKIYSYKNTKNPADRRKDVYSRDENRKSYSGDEKTKCSRCGYDKKHRTCYAIGQKCHTCSKYGHFSSQCFKNKLTKKIEYNRDSNRDSNSEDSDETELVTKAIKQLVKKVIILFQHKRQMIFAL